MGCYGKESEHLPSSNTSGGVTASWLITILSLGCSSYGIPNDQGNIVIFSAILSVKWIGHLAPRHLLPCLVIVTVTVGAAGIEKSPNPGGDGLMILSVGVHFSSPGCPQTNYM